jgi:long-chain acyl-CoA synthetase
VPNRDAIRKMVTNAEDEAQLKAAATALMGEIDKYRKGGQYADEFPDRWLPGAIAIVDEAFTEQNGLVNSTMKIVRAKVEEYFADRIEDLYTGEGKHPTSAKNLASIKKLAK